MKKWLKSLTVFAAIALVLVPCVLFSACSNNDDTAKNTDHTPAVGDTYVASKIEVDWTGVSYDHVPGITEDMSEEEKAAVIAEAKSKTEDMYKEYLEGSMVKITSNTEVVMLPKDGKEEDKEVYNYTIADGKVKAVEANPVEGSDPTKVEFLIKGETLVGSISMGGEGAPTVIITYTLSK